MKLECPKDKLSEAVSKAQAVTSKNVAVQILKCLYIEASGSRLVIRSTNLDLGVEITLPVKVDQEGKVAVLGQTLNTFMAALEREKSVSLKTKESTLIISSSKTSAQLKTFP